MTGTTILDTQSLPALTIDPPPVLTTTSLASLIEDSAETHQTVRFTDADDTLGWEVGTCIGVVVDIENEQSLSVTLSLTPTPDFYGTASIGLIVTDAFGPTTYAIPIAVTNTNDRPVAELAAIDEAVADPASGRAVRIQGDLRILPGVDPDVTRSAGTRYLGWEAAVDGSDGIDLLSLAGITGYAVSTNSIARVGSTSTTVATWTRPDGDSRRIAVTLGSSGTQNDLQNIAGMLRYVCIQGQADAVLRTLSLTVVEPNGGANVVYAAPATATCRVLAQNAPPIVSAHAVGVEPGGSAPIVLDVTDSDDPATIRVSLAKPLPRAGSVAPSSCSVSELAAGAMRYTHHDMDESADVIHLLVEDGRNPGVAIAVPVDVRIVVDRMDIISDPCLAAVRGVTTSWPVRFSCTPSQVAIAALPGVAQPLPTGAVDWSADAGLRFHWDAIPDSVGWLALRVVADTAQEDIPAGRRRAEQRMLIRIRPRPALAHGEGR
ncbi:MAG: hypothetical protein J0M02_11730 [Planctomycetes bacterium]|nr:hypothetical protein [Planctomycetota bacterium]